MAIRRCMVIDTEEIENMKSTIRMFFVRAATVCLVSLLPVSVAQAQTDLQIDPAALQQMRDLLLEKESRTAAQRKLNSRLVDASRLAAGGAPGLRVNAQNGTPGIDEN